MQSHHFFSFSIFPSPTLGITIHYYLNVKGRPSFLKSYPEFKLIAEIFQKSLSSDWNSDLQTPHFLNEKYVAAVTYDTSQKFCRCFESKVLFSIKNHGGIVTCINNSGYIACSFPQHWHTAHQKISNICCPDWHIPVTVPWMWVCSMCINWWHQVMLHDTTCVLHWNHGDHCQPSLSPTERDVVN